MKITVTGSKGFLGKYVVNALKEKGYETVDFDLPEHNLLDDDFSCLDGSDAVIHLAAMKGIPQCDADPLGALATNTLGTARLVEECNKRGIYLVYASTWAVNSHHKKMYDVSKKAAEEVIIHYIKRKKLRASILRMATFYGLGMADAGVINQFIKCKKEGKPAKVFGDGWEIRQFTHVKDITSALLTLLSNQPVDHEPFVATGKEVININDLGIKICGSLEHITTSDDPENYDVLFAKKLESLGWKQKVTLEEGIRKMLDDNKK